MHNLFKYFWIVVVVDLVVLVVDLVVVVDPVVRVVVDVWGDSDEVSKAIRKPASKANLNVILAKTTGHSLFHLEIFYLKNLECERSCDCFLLT